MTVELPGVLKDIGDDAYMVRLSLSDRPDWSEVLVGGCTCCAEWEKLNSLSVEQRKELARRVIAAWQKWAEDP